jgi:hypothetical protein
MIPNADAYGSMERLQDYVSIHPPRHVRYLDIARV